MHVALGVVHELDGLGGLEVGDADGRDGDELKELGSAHGCLQRGAADDLGQRPQLLQRRAFERPLGAEGEVAGAPRRFEDGGDDAPRGAEPNGGAQHHERIRRHGAGHLARRVLDHVEARAAVGAERRADRDDVDGRVAVGGDALVHGERAALDRAAQMILQPGLVEMRPPLAQVGDDLRADLDPPHAEADARHRRGQREADVAEAEHAHGAIGEILWDKHEWREGPGLVRLDCF